MKTVVVIPAYNEGKRIAFVVKDLKKHRFTNVIVVDDGSKDRTREEALKAGAVVLTHVLNRGQGASLQTGIDAALDGGADIICTFDADGQHRVEDLKKMVSLVKSGKYDVVLGSRFLKGAERKMPLSREILLRGSILVQKLFYRIDLTDAHNGLRAFSRKAAQKINITSDRMEHASQIAEEIKRHKLKYKEVPVNIKYDDYSLAKGHGSYLRAIEVFLYMLKRRLLK